MEATEIQLRGAHTNAIVVSTLAEAYAMIDSPLLETGLLKQARIKQKQCKASKHKVTPNKGAPGIPHHPR